MKRLKDRWFTTVEGIKLHQTIIECLLKNKELTSIKGLTKHEGRWDLRGITTPADQYSGGSSLQKPFTVRNVSLENVDLSYAVLYESVWDKCLFKNVIFRLTKADYSKFWACKFEDVIFEKTYLKEALMNATLENDSGYFKNVNFNEVNLKGTTYTNTLFEKCNFLECKLDHVDFNGSRFIDCKFRGRLSEVFFRGNEMVNHKLYPQRKSIPNKMINVDFSDATMESVEFLDGIDLSTCVFPISEDYILIRKDRKKLFETARDIIDKTWSDLGRRIGLTLIDQGYLSLRKKDLTIELVDRHYLISGDKGNNNYGQQFFNLIKELHQQSMAE